MAKTKGMTYTVGATVNTGNYNSFRFDVSETVELEEGDNPEAVYGELRERCITKILNERAALTGGGA